MGEDGEEGGRGTRIQVDNGFHAGRRVGRRYFQGGRWKKREKREDFSTFH